MPNDHFVPRTYLKPFTYDGSHLCVYYKATNHFDPKVSTKKVCSIENFYTLPTSLVGSGHERDLEDGYLQQKDAPFGGFRQELERLVQTGDEVSPDLRRNLAVYLGLQIVRTPVYRNHSAAIMEDHFARGEYPTPPAPYANDGRLSGDTLAFLQARDLKSELPTNIARYLYSLPWQLAENRTEVPFYTSDSPLVWHQYGPQPPNMRRVEGDGFFAFPVTPKLALTAWWGPSFDDVGPRSLLRVIDKADVVFCNALQIGQSHLHVFSQTNHSQACRNFCGDHPEVCDPERHKREAVELARSEIARQVQAEVRGGMS